MSGTTPPGGPEDPRPDPFATPGESQGEPPAGTEGGPVWSQDQPTASPYQQAMPGAPSTIRTAVRLMYVGAVLSAVAGIATLFARDTIKDNLIEANETAEDRLTADQIDAATNTFVGIVITVSVISVLLWLWMARANQQGKSWARVTATVLGALNILFTVVSVASGNSSGLNLVFNLITIALAAVILYFLYRPESGEYYRVRSRPY